MGVPFRFAENANTISSVRAFGHAGNMTTRRPERPSSRAGLHRPGKSRETRRRVQLEWNYWSIEATPTSTLSQLLILVDEEQSKVLVSPVPRSLMEPQMAIPMMPPSES